jgi:hypothetical protein
MIFFNRLIVLLSIFFVFNAFADRTIVIQKTAISAQNNPVESSQSHFYIPSKEVKIAFICAPKVIGKYSQSTYNVALATLLGKHLQTATLKRFDISDESIESLSLVLSKIHQEGFNALLAPLTLSGTQRIATLEKEIPVFIPTVHKRDVPDAPDNIVFGSIDYMKQIQALLPYMGNSIAIFYDDSAVGIHLKKNTEMLFMETDGSKKTLASYAVNAQGDNIISHLSKPSNFNKKSIILHLPIVKSAILTSQMTFNGIKERNILSTQINVDPALITLTQYHDRKNMILANSIIEHPPAVTESNALMNNDIYFDWINYATSVGADYLIAQLTNNEREYSMRLIDSQIIYPVELLKAKEFGFEPITSH